VVSRDSKGLNVESGAFASRFARPGLAFRVRVRYLTASISSARNWNAMTNAATAPAVETPSIPTSPQRLLARLDALGIAYRNHEHAAVFTVEEAKALRGELAGGHIKNLFLRNKKEEMWLVVAEEAKRIDLQALGERLGAGKLSFGSADRLMRYLGVLPGAVTPFGIVNDTERKVKVVLDRDLLGLDPVNAHPLVNTMTTALAPGDLVRFLEAESHAPVVIEV
jgi:Ala-tRNA(Pro) deacylase